MASASKVTSTVTSPLDVIVVGAGGAGLAAAVSAAVADAGGTAVPVGVPVLSAGRSTPGR